MSSTNEQNEHKDQSGSVYADEIIAGHTYDGIQEYDNPMPLWWKAVFAVTIIWSPIYIGLLEMGVIGNYQEQLREEDDYWNAKIAKEKAAEPELTPEKIKEEMAQPARIAAGKEIFATNCSMCHGAKGEGVIGPNLTDKYWLHGGTADSIFNTINHGVPPKGMPAWGPQLGQDKVLSVAAFVHSLKNTNVKGKEPQGEPLVEDGDDGGAPEGDAGKAAAGEAAGENVGNTEEADAGGADAENGADDAKPADGANEDAAAAPDAPEGK